MPRILGSKVVNGKVIPPHAEVARNPFMVLDAEIKTLEMQLEGVRAAKQTLAKLWQSNS